MDLAWDLVRFSEFGGWQNRKPSTLALGRRALRPSVQGVLSAWSAMLLSASIPTLFNHPEGPYTLPMELGPKKPSPLWFWGPNSIMAVYVGPSGSRGNHTAYLCHSSERSSGGPIHRLIQATHFQQEYAAELLEEIVCTSMHLMSKRA